MSTTPDQGAEWWTTSDVAKYLGVRVATVSAYRKRGQMPAPDQSIGRTQVWRPDRIVTWHEGRPRPGIGGRPLPAHSEDDQRNVEPLTPEAVDSPSRWTVFGERVLYDNRWARLSLVDVQAPHGERYESHVVTLPPAAMAAILDDSGHNVLLMWRHRFAVDLWNWELPGGVVEPGEDPKVTAFRETIEETGYRPRVLEHVVTFEPMVGQVRSPHHVYIGRGAELICDPTEKSEADSIKWKPLDEVRDLIEEGKVSNSGTLVALLYLLATKTG